MTPEGFSDTVPDLRLVWDASTLSSYMKDPLGYYWSYVQGYRSLNLPLTPIWGGCWAHVTANYRALRLRGFSKDDALTRTILEFLASPQSHELHEAWEYATPANQKKRNLYTLVRSLIWWADEYENDGWHTVLLPGNKPALEYGFLVPLGHKAFTGEDYLLAGYFDEIAEEEDGQFIIERKTTTQTLGTAYFQKYDPNIQTYLYDLVGDYILPHNPLRGVIVEACQTGVEFSRFERHEVLRTKPQREHFTEVLKYWIQRAEDDARLNRWPYAINSESNTYWSTSKNIERLAPQDWHRYLTVDFQKSKLWNPMEPRTIEVNCD